MKIRVTNHCKKQIVMRKKWKNSENKKKKSMFFAIWVFSEMINKKSYKWSPCIISNDNADKYKIYNKESWYKFIYHYNKITNEYTLITFMIVTKIDIWVWEVLRILNSKN